jgi:hypothetical protein
MTEYYVPAEAEIWEGAAHVHSVDLAIHGKEAMDKFYAQWGSSSISTQLFELGRLMDEMTSPEELERTLGPELWAEYSRLTQPF